MSDNKTGILLEAGTNELEVLVFTLGKLRCGVNVAKVREVIGSIKPTRVPRAHPAVVGVANLRGTVLTLVDLQLYFHPGQPSQATQRHVIIMEFNDLQMGFVVDGVEQIYRLGWQQVETAPASQEGELAAVTSICHVNDTLVLMIDFEKIAFDIQGVDMTRQALGENTAALDRGNRRILLAEDSQTTRRFLQQRLTEAGYTQVTVTKDGQQAWNALLATVGGVAPAFEVLVTDIEMPQMDGLHLCRRVREHPALKDLPVVVFSSLVSEDNLKKMNAVGANATITKPQLVKLVEIVDGLLSREPAPA